MRTARHRATVQLADELLGIAREYDPSLEPKYNKFYIGTAKDGQPFNFVVFRPRKKHIGLSIKLPRSDEIDDRLHAAEVETLEYRSGSCRLALSREDIKKNRELLKELIGMAYQDPVS